MSSMLAILTRLFLLAGGLSSVRYTSGPEVVTRAGTPVRLSSFFVLSRPPWTVRSLCYLHEGRACCRMCPAVVRSPRLQGLRRYRCFKHSSDILLLSVHSTPVSFTLLPSMWHASLSPPFFQLFRFPAFAVYAPWCTSCRSFAPTYDALARAIAASPTGGSVRVARVDGWTYSVLCRRFRVNAFPSFVILQGGYVYEHTGKWTPNGLLKFALPPPLRMSDLAAATAQKDEGGHATADGNGGDGNNDGGRGTATRKYPAVAAQEDVVVNGARVDRPFGPMAPHWRLATYLSAVGGDIAAAGRDLSTVQLGGVVVGSGMALTFVIVLGLAVLTTPGVFKFD